MPEINDETRLTDFLPEGFMALDFVAAVKCLDKEGNVSLASFRSSDLTAWEAWGMLNTAIEDIRRDVNTMDVRDD